MRPQPDDVELVLALVIDPGPDQLSLKTPPLVRTRDPPRGRRGLTERRRHLRYLAVGLLEQVVVGRRARLEPTIDPVDAGHQHRREREVRIGRRVGAPELDPLRLRRVRVHRDPDARGAVSLRVDEVDGRLVPGHQPTVRVRRRRAEGEQCGRMRQQAADTSARRGEPRVAHLVAISCRPPQGLRCASQPCREDRFAWVTSAGGTARS